MDSPTLYPESPMDQDDVAYPCKGCGEILEEGKAFELAGNRWHIDCFRCNTCGTLLDSDANLLLLGDGSLICNNCTYSCSSCGNKIEDLAILTGDQAFCANCFKCRNCKKKIENLRYARTSQGIFCMDCHEKIQARRRKRTTRNALQRQQMSSNSSVKLDKSLPSLPQTDASKSALSPEIETPPSATYSELPADVPSRARPTEDVSRRREQSPAMVQNNLPDTLSLPLSSSRNIRHSMISQRSDLSGGDEFLIPLAFDPTPPPAQSPQISNQRTNGTATGRSRDYFGAKIPLTSNQKPPTDMTASQQSSPHIAFQEKGRQPQTLDNAFDVNRRRKDGTGSGSGSAATSPQVGSERTRRQFAESPKASQSSREEPGPSERFKLQEVPKTKRSGGSKRSSRSEVIAQHLEPAELSSHKDEEKLEGAGENIGLDAQLVQEPESLKAMTYSTPRLSEDYQQYEPGEAEVTDDTASLQHPTMGQIQELPKRGDSLQGSKVGQSIPRKELPASSSVPMATVPASDQGAEHTTDSVVDDIDKVTKVNGGKIISKPIESPMSKSILDTPNMIQNQPENAAGGPARESFVAPRAPPPLPPYDAGRTRNGSVSGFQSEAHRTNEPPISPSLLRYSAGGEFSLDEDMARILGGDESSAQESFLRRVSNSVRHGRSFSDKGTRLSKEHRWPRTPVVGSGVVAQEISSPSSASPEHRDELSWFRNELRRERQKTVERDQKIAELEATLESTANIKQVNTELREKRSTMVVLDTQKEIVVRELEVLTEHIAAAKRSGDPLDLGKMKSAVLREFAEALQRLKDSFAPQIEESIQKRNDLVDEISGLTQMKDKSFQEFEQLSLKNAQLAELNNQLVHQIQELYKANSGATAETARPAPNGLGIYSHHKDKSQVSIDSREARTALTENSIPGSGTTLQQEEAEPVTMLQGPHVVNIRKGQPKKFNWKKGGQNVAKGVTKGLKGAFSSTQQSYSRELAFAETTPYGALQPGQEPTIGTRIGNEPSRQGFGLFGNQKTAPRGTTAWRSQLNGSSSALPLDAATCLYGSDLEQRAEFERVDIPVIVTRCIQEVELRGMDVEGIYRKSGGSSQIQIIKDGFERSPNDFDLSDPDLDIHAVTSGLKQYFRKLPMPLITYEVYDKLLDTTNVPEVEKEKRIEAMHRALGDLPKVHRDVLEFLTFHLKRVVEREIENLMTSTNIAVVFAPTIMRPESLSREMTDTGRKNEVVQFLVENCHAIFMDSH